MVLIESPEARVRVAVEQEMAAELARRGSGRLGLEDQDWLYRLVGRMVADEQRRTGGAGEKAAAADLWRRVYAAVSPLGPLAEHLADPEVEEVRLNGTESCFVIRRGRRERVPPPFGTTDALVALVQWYADGAGTARLDRSSPMVTLTLPDGSRLHAALSPPARPLSITIRRHVVSRFGCLDDLAKAGLAPSGTMGLLGAMVKARLNILIAGGTGAGKTTLVRALCRAIPEDERVITIEDQAELHVWPELPDCVSLEGRPANSEGRGAISIQMLVHEALRMSPDRIVIGEVRGGEALDLLDAMNTGHPVSRSVYTPPTVPKVTSAGIYVRISMDRTKTGQGVDNQEAECLAKAEELGWPVSKHHIYSDSDFSAFKKGVVRPGYQRMLDDIKAGELDGLVSWHSDRMHRQTLESELFVRQLDAYVAKTKKEFSIQTVQAGVMDFTTPGGRKAIRDLASTAEYESDIKSARVKMKMAQLAADGKWGGGPRPFGWDRSGVVAVPAEQELIKEAARRVLAGETCRSICADFEARGVKGVRGRPIQPTTLRKMLVAPRMVGLWAHKDGTITTKGNWAPVLETDEWKELERILKDPERNQRTQAIERKYLLSGGVIRCGATLPDGSRCGRPLVARRAFRGRKDGYYFCRKAPGELGCGTIAVPIGQADRYAEALALSLLNTEDFAKARLRISQAPEDVAGLDQIFEEIAGLEGEIAEITSLNSLPFGDSRRLSPTQVSTMTASHRQAIEVRRDKLEKARRRSGVKEIGDPQEIVSEWPSYPIERRREVLRRLFAGIFVLPFLDEARRVRPYRFHPEWAV